MNAPPTTVRPSFDVASGNTSAVSRHRDDSPSAFAQTLRRLERDMWRGATAGHAPSAPNQAVSPRAAPSLASASAPAPARPARAPASVPATPPSVGYCSPMRRDVVVAEPEATVSTQRPPARSGGNVQALLAPTPPMSIAPGAHRAASVTASPPAPATFPSSSRHAGETAPRPASGPHCRLSVLTGAVGLSIAVRAAGIDDSTLAQRAFVELRRLGVPSARLFINGRLFIEMHRLSGGTHGD